MNQLNQFQCSPRGSPVFTVTTQNPVQLINPFKGWSTSRSQEANLSTSNYSVKEDIKKHILQGKIITTLNWL